MPRTALEDLDYEMIKAHILKPEESALNHEQQQMFDRVLSIARVMDKQPISKNAVAIHRAKYPELGRSRAYMDLELARKLFNTIHKFDYDFWQTWTINDIVKNIQALRTENTAAARRAIAMEHSNLIKALGDRPEIPNDPRLNEKHEFNFLIQINNGSETKQIKINEALLKQLKPAALEELNRLLFAPQEITEDQAAEIMET